MRIGVSGQGKARNQNIEQPLNLDLDLTATSGPHMLAYLAPCRKRPLPDKSSQRSAGRVPSISASARDWRAEEHGEGVRVRSGV